MKTKQQKSPFNIVLADDDNDDCLFFKEALKGFGMPAHLTVVQDGEELMRLLTDETVQLPNLLFLDLNMPRKNGYECLSEIKLNKKLKHLPVIIYSTSFHKKFADILYEAGANYYISKPSEFSKLKKAVQKMISFIAGDNFQHPVREKFLLTEEKKNSRSFLWFQDFFITPGAKETN